MAKDDGKKRSSDAVSHIAKATGVDEGSVEKILKHLGLQTALSLHPGASPNNLRVAAGQVLR